MKTTILWCLAAVFTWSTINVSLAQSDQSASPVMKVDRHPLEGAWKMVAHKTIQGEIVQETLKLGDEPESGYWQTKILTDSHFAFGRQTDDGEDIIAGGGTYSVNGDTYTEVIEYHFSAPLVGTKIPFEWRIDEQGYWHHTGTIGDLYLHEIYDRIK